MISPVCFAIYNMRSVEEIRNALKGNDRLLAFYEREAKQTLGDLYEPPVLDREPDRVVPDFGRRVKVTA